MGQLMLALAGDGAERPGRARRSRGMQTATRRVEREVQLVHEAGPREPRFAPPPMPEAGDDVELMLADARARAHELIDDSVRRAQEVLTRRIGPDTGEGDPLRRTVATLVTDVRALHRRLDAIEALLRAAVPGGAARAEPASPRAAAPVPAPPSLSPPMPVAPPAPAPLPPAVPLPESTVELQAAEPTQEVAAPPPSAPVTAAAVTPPSAAAPPPEPAPPPVPVPAATPVNGARSAPAVVFAANEGTVVLRIAPVAGFQGLMRVQDALGQVQGVREAGVEAYAQGEARLRLQLGGSLDSEQLANALSALLGREARLAAASLTDRSITMTLD